MIIFPNSRSSFIVNTASFTSNKISNSHEDERINSKHEKYHRSTGLKEHKKPWKEEFGRDSMPVFPCFLPCPEIVYRQETVNIRGHFPY
jgi:hypothetical protein